ncbi:MAG: hypothetical protein AABM66_06055 [Actinomycetota bacterium]
MTHEIDAAMCFVEPLVSESPVDLIAAYARIQQLPPRHHAVLAACEARDGPVNGSTE